MFSSHPIWLAGFRPFFSLACLSGLSLPVLWVLMLSGHLPAPASPLSPTQWHAHEMFYGFGWAVLGGFLLTSTKNWVNIRGYHGLTLVYLSAAWMLERLCISFGKLLPTVLFWVGSQLFLISICFLLLRTLIRHRQQDNYQQDNRFFIAILIAFGLAKTLLLLPEYFVHGVSMTLALFRLAFLVMLERTMTQFMKGVCSVNILRHPILDNSIKLLALSLVIAALNPPPVAAPVELLLAILLLGRLFFWHPLKALARLDLGIMVLGYLAIVLQLAVSALSLWSGINWVGSFSVHLFTFGAMGLVIPAMLIRIGHGHTGRKIVFGRYEKSVLWLMIGAAVLRLLGPQILPSAYLHWLYGAAACWFMAFGLLARRLIPYFISARVDGREH